MPVCVRFACARAFFILKYLLLTFIIFPQLIILFHFSTGGGLPKCP